MAYEVIMVYHLHMPSYFLGTFTEYPEKEKSDYLTGKYDWERECVTEESSLGVDLSINSKRNNRCNF